MTTAAKAKKEGLKEEDVVAVCIFNYDGFVD
jgi:hypothetical protein